jgi:uracil-DNA glycosylase family 4
MSTLEERKAIMADIAARVSVCTLCQLHKGRTKAVPGAGPVEADIMFIGEGPGYNEDKQGLPFVGQSGRLLEELLALIGLNRNQVFIGNVVKCRPPENRDPLPDEVSTCTKTYLFKQIETINPKVIVTLGRYSMGLFFPGSKITAIQGKPKWEHDRAYLPLFHPAAVLRNMGLRPQIEAGMRLIPTLIEEWRKKQAKDTKPPEPPQEPPTQLSLF